MKKTVIFSILSFLAATNAAAFTGNDLLKTCSTTSLEPICIAYIGGVADGIMILDDYANHAGALKNHVVCIPEGVIHNQIADIAVSYIRAKPELRHLSASNLILRALVEKFPACTSR